jgi:hypothetical protein
VAVATKWSHSSETSASSDNELSTRREAVRCATCGATNDHYTRKCTEQTCLSCGAKGHAKVDCKQREKKEEENKPSPSKYLSELVVREAAPVLKIAAKIDGKSAVVGLDTYAGAGMVLEELVRGRMAEWRPTTVVLEGVANELMKPLGKLVVTVGMGPGRSFEEEVLAVRRLPGDVQALVSFDTLQKVGLSVSTEEVRVGGEPVVLVGGVVRTEETVAKAANMAEKERPEGA